MTKIWFDGLACHCFAVQDNENESSNVSCLDAWSGRKSKLRLLRFER